MSLRPTCPVRQKMTLAISWLSPFRHWRSASAEAEPHDFSREHHEQPGRIVRTLHRLSPQSQFAVNHYPRGEQPITDLYSSLKNTFVIRGSAIRLQQPAPVPSSTCTRHGPGTSTHPGASVTPPVCASTVRTFDWTCLGEACAQRRTIPVSPPARMTIG